VTIGTSSYTTVLSLPLPAGAYVVNGKTTLQGAGSIFVASCQLLLSTAALTVDTTYGQGAGTILASNIATVTLPSPDTVLLQCNQPIVLDNVVTQNSQLVATLVGGVN
jgi:hypothetical protein